MSGFRGGQLETESVMRTAADIRQSFIDFFCRKHGHSFVPGAAVIPYEDPTLLFTNAGMNQFKPLFLGTADRGSEFGRLRRAANSQPCIRAGGKHNDLDDVGHDTYHHTFFEMLGNWSFGDYFKREAIAWAWELLTKEWGLDPRRLHATYFGGAGRGSILPPERRDRDDHDDLEPDFEARDLWKEIAGLRDDQVHAGNKKDNFWEMGDTGPCGPCSEIHVDLTPDFSGSRLVNTGDARVIEIWNNVFIQFNRGADGRLSPLPAKHVDTGMGLERVSAIIQGHNNNYATDLFVPIIQAVETLSGHAYGKDGATEGRRAEGIGRYARFDAGNMRDTACRVIADHIRTLTFAISDGCPPDKDGRGFVLRRILRRAVRYGWQHLGLHEPFLCRIAPTVVDVMGAAFPQLKKNPARIVEVLRDEEESFGRTLERGLALFEEAADTARRQHHGEIQGGDAFKLHDTYGFPIDLTEIMAGEKGLKINIGEYERLMEEARQKARVRGAASSDWIEHLPAELRALIAPTDDSARYSTDRLEAEVLLPLCLEPDGRITVPPKEGSLHGGQRGVLFLNRTCFYAEQGGQCGDRGAILTGADGGESQDVFEVEDTIRIGDAVAHVGRVLRGGFGWGEPVFLQVSAQRPRIKSNHTATHVPTGLCAKCSTRTARTSCSRKARSSMSIRRALTSRTRGRSKRPSWSRSRRTASGRFTPISKSSRTKSTGRRARS
jgi:alanyl-tRNA synthetase